METHGEFLARLQQEFWQCNCANCLGENEHFALCATTQQMVEARDAEIRRESENSTAAEAMFYTRDVDAVERQKRIDERANAIINGRAMHYGYCSDEWWAAAYESAIMGEVWRQRFIEAERERRLARKDAPTA